MKEKTKPVSLSTMWGVGRFERFAQFYEAANAFGFQQIELNYQVNPAFLSEALSIKGLPISSVHAPVPHTQLSENRWAHELSFCSLDETERRLALSYARPTIDLAAKVGPCPVVLHVGNSGLDPSLSRKLRELFDSGRKDTPEYHELKLSLEKKRHNSSEKYMDQARKSIVELSRYAADSGVVLALESRYHFHEMPNLEEMGALLALGDTRALGYWHDVGHCENLSRLGFTPHEDWLQQLGPRIVGAHLHDLIGLADHRAVGKGDLDLSLVAMYLPDTAIRVCEFANWNDDSDVAASVAILREKGVI